MSEHAAKLAEDDDSTVLAAARDNWQSAKDWLEPYHLEFDDLYAFLFKFEHYDDENATTRDRRRAKPKGRQLASKHRHKLANILKQSLYITTRAVDLDTDPEKAEEVRWMLEYEVHDPQKRFRRVLRRAVSLMLATGMGAIVLDVRDDLGDYPEVRPRLLDPRKLGWTPGWSDPDDDTCPWVTVESSMMISEIERRGEGDGKFRWDNTAGLSPDTNADALRGRSLPSDLPLRSAGASYPGQPTTADRVVVVYCWYRHDHTAKHDDDVYALESSQRYMACPSCPHRDYSGDGDKLPEQGGECPECAALGVPSIMGRVEREKIPRTTAAYSKGRRLVVFAPHQRRVFYDDDWPYSVNGRPMRNVPVALFKSYDLPLEPGASCDTIWDFSYQVIANATDRRLYEWISRAGGILIAGMDGLYNASGSAPFEFTDRPISLARWKGMGQPAVEYFQPHGMIAELMPFVSHWNNQFRADMGMSDLGLTATQSKDIPVGTVQQLVRSGEIPVDDHAEQVREALSPLFGTWYDIKRAIMSERQAVRLRGPDGADFLREMRGEEFPNADVIVGSGPSWDEFDAERVSKLRELLSPPPGMDPTTWSRLMPVLAEEANIPMETVRKVQRALMPPAPPAGAPGQPGMGAPPAIVQAGAPVGNGIPAAIAARMSSMGGGPPPA